MISVPGGGVARKTRETNARAPVDVTGLAAPRVIPVVLATGSWQGYLK